MERVVLALGAKGLVNAQFIVREDGVYLIEVNPRASRTVPFLSKVTGVPMVDLAVRIALGATLEELGWPNGLLPPPPFVAVKAPAFSTTKLRGVDPSVGPSMQSTGEVIGIHRDPRVALAKALRGAGLVPAAEPPAGSFVEATEAGARHAPMAFLSIADRDKGELPRLAAALDRAGFRLAATPGTRASIRAAGLDADPVAKLGAEPSPGSGEVALLDLLRAGSVRLVVNTPTPRSGAVRDAAEIRHTAVAEGVPCLTAIETAVAAAEALDSAVDALVADVRSLDRWVPSVSGPGRGVPESAGPLELVVR
jgi:carbamoyl-phosphate synthase large subunit